MQLQVEVFDHITQLVVIRVFPELWGRRSQELCWHRDSPTVPTWAGTLPVPHTKLCVPTRNQDRLVAPSCDWRLGRCPADSLGS